MLPPRLVKLREEYPEVPRVSTPIEQLHKADKVTGMQLLIRHVASRLDPLIKTSSTKTGAAEVTAAEVATVTEAASGKGYDAMVAAVGRAIDKLSRHRRGDRSHAACRGRTAAPRPGRVTP